MPHLSLIESIQSADPGRVEHYLTELKSRASEVFNKIAAGGDCLQCSSAIFGFSRFLSEEALRNPEWLLQIEDTHRSYSLEDYRDRLTDFLKQHSTDIASAAFNLALFRRKELMRIVVRDSLSLAPLPAVTEELSSLADAILGCALEMVIADLMPRYGQPRFEAASASADFAVLALGKLGGRELNYSSDIDLMFLYSENGETAGPEKITNREFFKKVSHRLTNLLSTHTGAGLCYRVDLRLRPEGSLGEVCLSLESAKHYYSKRARDWELQMLIKARVAAGDLTLGQSLLDFVEPLIYSTTLDFSTIETMSETRERISEKLARRRWRSGSLNVKLAPGGIRDIEFLVQCLQRLHGGREVWVRHGGTLLALNRLLDKDLLSKTEYSRLANAYEFLRHLEHRLQCEEDRQTHSLPSDPGELERLARRMPYGIPTGVELLRTLNQHLESVQGIYDRIVHAQRPLYYSPVSAAQPTIPVPTRPRDKEIAFAGIPEDYLKLLDRTAPDFATQLRERGLRRGEPAFARFLERVVPDPKYFQLLDGHRLLADYALQIFEHSPFLSEQLIQSPELLDEVRRVADHPNRRWAFEGLAAPLNDVPALRRFFQREMFRIQAGSICLTEAVFQTLDRTSALVEFVIARAYRISLEQAIAHARRHATERKPFQEPRNEMMVVALGRLGMREFDLGSDADLLFIIPESEAERQRFWTRVAEHLIDILTAYTGEGTMLSLDTRLRPNGREGMLVQTESKYVDYFAHTAEAWEGIAYMKARAVAGDVERATTFLSELQQVDWRRYGQSGRSKQNLRQMRMRLQREQGNQTPLKAGFGGYYDADFILMYLRLKGAGLFFKSLNTPERIDIVEKMGHLERSDAEFLLHATTFFRALDHGLRITTGRTDERLMESIVEQEMLADLLQRWTGRTFSSQSLKEELLTVQTKMRHLFDSIFIE